MAENGGDINLATLWIPVTAETSHIKEQLSNAGAEGAKEFSQSFQRNFNGQELFQKAYDSAIKATWAKAGREHAKEYIDSMNPRESGNKIAAGLGDGLKDGFGEAMPKISNILSGGIVAGLTAAFVTKGLEVVTEAMTKIVEVVADGVEKAADEILKIGEAWELVDRQLQTTTSASGDALEGLRQSADNVVRSGLGVSMDKLGTTMGTLAQRTGLEAGPALEQLSKQVMELGARFGSVNLDRLTGAFNVYGVKNYEAALQSLLNSARNTGTNLNEIIDGARQGGAVLAQTGMSIGQAGAFVAQLSKAGLDLKPVLTGLQMAEKDFVKEGVPFNEGLRNTLQKINDLITAGRSDDARALAEKIFGPRNWATVLQAISDHVLDFKTLLSSIGPDTGQGINDFIDSTATLEERFTSLKQKAEEIFKPFGDSAMGQIGHALDGLGGWIDANRTKIVGWIQSIGDKFIAQLPAIEGFAAGMLGIIGPVIDIITQLFAISMDTFTTWMDMFLRPIHEMPKMMATLLFGPMGSGLKDMADNFINTEPSILKMSKAIGEVRVTPELNQLSQWIQEHKTDVDNATQSWDNYTNSMKGATVGPYGLPAAPAPSSGPSFGPWGPGGGGPGGIGGNIPRGFGPGTGGGGETAALNLASSMAGRTPYNMAPGDNFSPSGIDCSGLVSAEVNAFVGDSPFSSRMSTPVEADWLRQRGFVDGTGPEGTLRVGWYDHGGGEYGHTAMTLPDGTNVESTTGNGFNGVRMGASARGAADGLFDHHMYLPLPGSGPARGGAGGSRLGGFSRSGGPGISPSPTPPVITDNSGNTYIVHTPAISGTPVPDTSGPAISGTPVPDTSGPDISVDFPQPIQFPNVDIPDTPGAVGGSSGPAPAAIVAPDVNYTPYMPISLPVTGYNRQGSPMSGAFGGITQEQGSRDIEEIQNRQHELERLNAEISSLRTEIDNAKQSGADATKLHDLNQRLQESLWNQAKASQSVADAQTKFTTDWNKQAESSSGSKSSSRESSIGSQLGSGLLKGIGQELGFGDLFGKSPMDWGLVKLATGLMGWGIGEANAWGDAITGQGGAAGGAAGGGGALSGLLGGLLPGAKSILPGVNPAISTPNVVGAPNVVSAQGLPTSAQPSAATPTINGNIGDTYNIQAQNPQAAATTMQHLNNSTGYQSSTMSNAGMGPVGGR
jgi:hypothetical protein